MALTDYEMMEPLATIHWCAADIKSLQPDWSDEKCVEVLSDIGDYLEQRSIELGWEVIEVLLRTFTVTTDEDEE